jgi:hypothetical protein
MRHHNLDDNAFESIVEQCVRLARNLAISNFALTIAALAY